MAFVLDCSITLTWFFEDEDNPYAMLVLDSLAETEAVVPVIWTLEVPNGLLTAERRGRLTADKANQAIELLKKLSIRVDVLENGMQPLLALARDCKLTTYDAAYLELAKRCQLPLATSDQALAKAARLSNVQLADFHPTP
ncbi:MAG TPA: type II toxin-antitoxin system VapC family toxin [Spirochaetia bacterium]|nr:type II toxin-antitoxin system VapC family toxin [Spirochaetia bacterium]